MQPLKMTFFLALLLVTLVPSVKCGQIYGSYVSATDSETIMWTASVDMDTGAMSNITEVEVFGGSSLTYDGISAYDAKNNIYYWTNDYETPLLYAVSTTSMLNLPVSDLYVQSISRIVVNQKTSEVVLAVYQSNLTRVLAQSYPPGNLRVLSSNFPYSEILGITYDSDSDTLVFLVFSNGLALVNMNPQTGSLGKLIPLKGNPDDINPENIYYDHTTGNIFGGGTTSNLTYGILTINPANGATTTDFPIISDDGIVVAWSLDNSNSWMWYSAATDEGTFLFAWDPATNNQTAQIPTQFLLENIELAV